MTNSVPEDGVDSRVGEFLLELVEPITRAVVFEDCGNTEDWRDNTNYGIAAVGAIKPRIEALLHDKADLERKLGVARERMTGVSKWRADCHAHDDDMGHEPRDFDSEDWDMVEAFADRALKEIGDDDVK